MNTNEIRERFLCFFEAKGHRIIKSDSLAPANDPSLLFTGAGMNQFKDYFLGVKKDLRRACSSQKCLRTGDLDRVGKTAYHHSFFEMLGNFSFGDYFKKEAIAWAWEFLTQELSIPKEKLRVSVHREDEESYGLWRDIIGVPADSIAKLGDDSNFWPANARIDGPNGPCGPCSEIYFDQGENYPGAKPNVQWHEDESGRFAEIWNLVFTQFDRRPDGALNPLASKNIDTGAGLERIACILQHKKTNFEIDIFDPILRAIRSQLKLGKSANMVHVYAIADHVRAITFAIADGIFPSNEGRGYVIRKLIRRSIWQGHAFHADRPFLFQLVPAVNEAMGGAYPELKQAEKSVTETIRSEEERFFETLERGLSVLEKLITQASRNPEKRLDGDDVFLLYDTYGFPDELTKQIVLERGLTIDQTGYERLMAEQRKRAKEKSKMADTIFSIDESKKETAHLTPTKFLGYETLESDGTILWTKQTPAGDCIVLDQSPFYPEGGGQAGDQGSLCGRDFEFEVENTLKLEKLILHIGRVQKGKLAEKLAVHASVNPEKRNATRRNHTATHLLQAALRKQLGNHVRQVGSFVNSEKLRFDFLHGKGLSREEIMQIEHDVNETILANCPVETRKENYKKAAEEGALAFFGDKYDDVVRVIEVPGVSKELCGGTHCARTGDIGSFVIVSESAIASGTRRIEALTGLGAVQYGQNVRRQLKDASDSLKVPPDQIKEKVERLNHALAAAEKEKRYAVSAQILDVDRILAGAKTIGTVCFVGESLPELGIEELRKACDDIRKKMPKPSVVALFGTSEGKVSLVVGVSKDLEASDLCAGNLVRELSRVCEGSGGGKKDFAQGGGKNPEKVPNAIAKALELIQKHQG